MRAALVLLLLLATPGWAHEARPVSVQIKELTAHTYRVQWQLPPSLPASAWPWVQLPADCRADVPVTRRVRDAFIRQQLFRCAQALAGRPLQLRYPAANPSVSAIWQVSLLSGEQHSHLMTPGQERWQLPEAEQPLALAGQYLWLGVGHIWAGIDHLLFVACLLFIARAPGRLLLTITGFTLAHSLTLVAASLNWLRLPVPPVEAVIALSIVFLATEIARPRADSWTWRYPVLVSTSFGLLHGFGFAAALSEIGLPQTQRALALLTFNLGVELGQLLFVAACLTGFYLWRLSAPRLPPAARTVPWNRWISYGVGSLASFWLFDRLAGFVA